MVLSLVLRANVGEDFQPKGLNSCWTAWSPRGEDALERSLKQMRGRFGASGRNMQEWVWVFSPPPNLPVPNRDYRHQQNPHLLLLVISP